MMTLKVNKTLCDIITKNKIGFMPKKEERNRPSVKRYGSGVVHHHKRYLTHPKRFRESR